MQNHCESSSKMLLQKKERLIAGFLEGKEPAFMERHAGILDDYFRESFEKSEVGPKMGMGRNPFAIIALGGYGRKEQCIHSDVDLLFLFKKRIPEEVKDLIREVIYPLWDIGFEIGYAIRSLKECIRLAGTDFNILTPLLDARLICGISPLYFELMEQLRWKVILRRKKKISNWIVEKNRERHKYFGDSAYLLEPNLKEGQGGLRDYHTMRWLAGIKSKLGHPMDLSACGFLSSSDSKALSEALSFIWNVRNHLHRLTGKKCDRLHFEYQIKLSEILEFGTENRHHPVEQFLGKLHAQMDFIKEHHRMFLYDHEVRNAKPSKPPGKGFNPPMIEGIEICRGRLGFASPETVCHNPKLLMKIFEESARLDIPLSPEAERLVKKSLHRFTEDFRTCASIIESFERILSAPGWGSDALNKMLDTGLLLRFIPEFKTIVNRIQYDAYHLYPVDKHSVRTVQFLKNFNTPEGEGKEPLCRTLYAELADPQLLQWAGLLHDIGKGVTAEGHSKKGAEIARDILTDKGYPCEDVETVSFLVNEHLFLIKTATRRDINDEETAVFCARKIKDIERLKMLYLLTIADSMATGPRAWNDWTFTLLRDLFLKTLNILEKGELASNEAVKDIEKKKLEILQSANTPQTRQDREVIFNFMSPRYLVYTATKEMLEDIKLYKSLGNKEFVWNITKTSGSNTRSVKICAKDRPGLFSKIAGVFTLNNLDILGAQVYTWRNHIALDIFEVKPPLDQLFEDERWARAEKNLESALSGKLDLASTIREKISADRLFQTHTPIRPPRIIIDNSSSSFFTIIEIFTYDFPGLLFTVTDILFRCKLDIWVAKIGTKVDQVVDVFYVRDFDGQKVDSPKDIETIRKTLYKVLSDFDPEPRSFNVSR